MKYEVLKDGLKVIFEQTDDKGKKTRVESESVEANLLYEVTKGLMAVNQQLEEVKKMVSVGGVMAQHGGLPAEGVTPAMAQAQILAQMGAKRGVNPFTGKRGLTAELLNQKWCMCKSIGTVARDGRSTCATCGGRDAYGASTERPEKYQKKTLPYPEPRRGLGGMLAGQPGVTVKKI